MKDTSMSLIAVIWAHPLPNSKVNQWAGNTCRCFRTQHSSATRAAVDLGQIRTFLEQPSFGDQDAELLGFLEYLSIKVFDAEQVYLKLQVNNSR